jgi:hypothetical protein
MVPERVRQVHRDVRETMSNDAEQNLCQRCLQEGRRTPVEAGRVLCAVCCEAENQAYRSKQPAGRSPSVRSGECPVCGYAMTAFDVSCPRCANLGRSGGQQLPHLAVDTHGGARRSGYPSTLVLALLGVGVLGLIILLASQPVGSVTPPDDSVSGQQMAIPLPPPAKRQSTPSPDTGGQASATLDIQPVAPTSPAQPETAGGPARVETPRRSSETQSRVGGDRPLARMRVNPADTVPGHPLPPRGSSPQGTPWQRITAGMTPAEVQQLLGRPTSTLPMGHDTSCQFWNVENRTKGFERDLSFTVWYANGVAAKKDVDWTTEEFKGSGRYGLYKHYDVSDEF